MAGKIKHLFRLSHHLSSNQWTFEILRGGKWSTIFTAKDLRSPASVNVDVVAKNLQYLDEESRLDQHFPKHDAYVYYYWGRTTISGVYETQRCG